MSATFSGVSVRKHPLWCWGDGFEVWMLECCYCDDSMEFATWEDAQAGADKHVRRHVREQCPHCRAVPPVRHSEWP